MTTNGLACFLIGLGTGIGLAILFAPERGEEIRERIKVRRDEGVESLKKGGEALKEMAADLTGKGQEAVDRAKDAFAGTVTADKKAIDESPGA